MSQPKRSSDTYIQFKKKITNKEIIKIVKVLTDETLFSAQEICYGFIVKGAQLEIEKRKNKPDVE